MLVHYSRWIPQLSKKLYALAHADRFPLLQAALQAFETLKKDIAESVTQAIDPTGSFTVEIDASKYAVAATLTQNEPVAFFYHTD